MFCGHCGSELQAIDKFCGVCGETNAEAAASAPAPPAPQAPAKKRPAPPPAAPPSGRAQRPQQAPENSAPSAPRKKALPDLPDTLPLKAKKKSNPAVIVLLVLILAAVAAASLMMVKKQGASKNDIPVAGKPNIKAFAASICGLTKTNPVAIDGSYNYEFHAIMSANDDLLSEKGYSLNEYIDYAVDDIKNQMAQQTFEKVENCNVKIADEKPCQEVYKDLSGALSRHGVNYSIASIAKAGSMQNLKTCGIIVLEESWAGSDGTFPIAYFVGATASKFSIINYFYSDYFSSK